MSSARGGTALAVEPHGSLGERTDLVHHSWPPPGPGQDGPHAHQIITSPDGGHVLAVDLGNDAVYTYRLDPRSGTLRQVGYAALRNRRRTAPPRLPSRRRPSEVLVTADGSVAYLANRGHNTITRYAIESGGAALRPLDRTPVGGDFPRHIAFDPAQRLLFAAPVPACVLPV